MECQDPELEKQGSFLGALLPHTEAEPLGSTEQWKERTMLEQS